LNIHHIPKINHHEVEINNCSTPDSISDIEDRLNWNGDLDNLNDSEEDCAADDDSDIKHNICIEDPECPEQQDVSATQNVTGLVLLTWKS
jgi:hypothetical protein